MTEFSIAVKENKREYQKRYRREHPEKVKKWKKDYYQKNREKILKNQKYRELRAKAKKLVRELDTMKFR